jgi:DNA-binding Lrp family transcriptional regulator
MYKYISELPMVNRKLFNSNNIFKSLMKLDKIDVKILTLLQKDARKSFREIAKELDISTPTISSKVNTLEKAEVIKGYRADISADRLSENSIILIIKCNPSHLDDVAKSLKDLENVNEIYILSNSRIFLKVTMINPLEINEFLANLTKIEKILEYDYYSIINTLKEIPRAIIRDNLSVTLNCYYCKKAMKDEPVKLKLDGKTHYVCCNTCAKQYTIKYNELKSKI